MKRTDPTLADMSEGHKNNFDFLRLLLAAAVLWYHCRPLLYGLAHGKLSAAEYLAGLIGDSAVDFFFVISGFLVTASWVRRPETGPYLRNRILRIYPAFIVASLFCAVVVGPLGAANAAAYWHQFNPFKFVAYMLLLVGPFLPPVFLHLPMPGAVDGSFWTLRYEFECYLLVIGLGLAGFHRNRVWLLALWAALFLLLVMQTAGHWTVLPDREFHLLGSPAKWLRLTMYFLTGSMFFLYRDRIPYSQSLFWISVALLCLASLRAGWVDPVLAICGSYALFFVAFQPHLKLQNFARYGDFSYGVYVYAFPIQQLLVQGFAKELTPLRLFCLALPLTILLAAASWHLIEKPCLRLKSRKFSWTRRTL